MADILFIYEREMPTVSCIKHDFEQWKRKKLLSVSFRRLTEVSCTDIDQNQVIAFIRPNDIYSPIIAKKARMAGHLVLVSCDDDLMHVKPGIPWRIRGLKKILSHTDVLWSPSQYICEKYRKYVKGRRTFTTDTIVREKQIATDVEGMRGKSCPYPLKIVYAAAPGHYVFFDQYIKPIMPKLIKKYGKKISFTFIGVKPDADMFASEIEIHYVRGMPLLEYRSFIKNGGFDIGIAPLPGNGFTKCKYYNKYIEYSMAGIMGIYSNVIPYAGKVKHMENGLLADNTAAGWYRAFCMAIDDKKLRSACVKNAQKDLKENHIEDAIVKKMLYAVPELKQKRKHTLKCGSFFLGKCLYYFQRPLDWAYLCCYYLRNGGIAGFRDRVVLHMRNRRR